MARLRRGEAVGASRYPTSLRGQFGHGGAESGIGRGSPGQRTNSFTVGEDPEQKRVGDGWADTIVCQRAQVPSTSKQTGMRFALGLLLGITTDMALLMTGWLIQMNS